MVPGRSVDGGASRGKSARLTVKRGREDRIRRNEGDGVGGGGGQVLKSGNA